MVRGRGEVELVVVAGGVVEVVGGRGGLDETVGMPDTTTEVEGVGRVGVKSVAGATQYHLAGVSATPLLPGAGATHPRCGFRERFVVTTRREGVIGEGTACFGILGEGWSLREVPSRIEGRVGGFFLAAGLV